MNMATLARTPGFQFITVDEIHGQNALVNGITGVGPTVVRGTDPANYVADMLGLNQAANAPADVEVKPAGWQEDLVGGVKAALEPFLVGAAGVALALVLVAIGVFVLVQGVRNG